MKAHGFNQELSADSTLTDFDTVWQTLTPREQARMLHLLIGRIEFDAGDSSLAISFHGTGIKTLADEVTA